MFFTVSLLYELKTWINKIKYAINQYDALIGADALIIATEWSEFRTPDFTIIEAKLKQKAVFDGRNLFDVNLLLT